MESLNGTATGAYVLNMTAPGTPVLTRGWRRAPTSELEQLSRELSERADEAEKRAEALADIAEAVVTELDVRAYWDDDPATEAERQDAQDADASLQDRFGKMPGYAS